jgi:hypothetical protein
MRLSHGSGEGARAGRVPLVAFAFLLFGSALAAIGEPPAVVLAAIEKHQPRESQGGGYLAGSDFAFEFVLSAVVGAGTER